MKLAFFNDRKFFDLSENFLCHDVIDVDPLVPDDDLRRSNFLERSESKLNQIKNGQNGCNPEIQNFFHNDCFYFFFLL